MAAMAVRLQRMICSCCGAETSAKEQWFNRDTGFGMCVSCIKWIRGRGMPEDEIKSLYGVEGTHWGVQGE